MKKLKKQFDFRMLGGYILIVAVMVGIFVLVGGNNQRAQADVSESGISINLRFNEILTLLKTYLSSGVAAIEPIFSGVTNYDSLTLGDDLIVGGTSTFTGAITMSSTLDVTATTTTGSSGTPAYQTIGGIDYAFVQQTFATSSNLCSFGNPFGSATTTMEKITVVTTSRFGAAANTFDIATSTSNHGTSTVALLHAVSIPSNGLVFIDWNPQSASSTVTGAATANRTLFDNINLDGSPYILAPNLFLNVKIATSSPGNETITGTCSATFRKP